MDLVTNTWTTSDPAPLAVALLAASILIGLAGTVTSLLVFNKARTARKVAGVTIGLTAVAALAIMLPAAYSLPRENNPNAGSYVQAAGMIDTITPDLNHGGTGIRLTEHPEVLLTVNDNDADTFAGLEDHRSTLYCTPPADIDQDNPALAAGTILDCSSTPNPIRNSRPDALFPPAIPGSTQTTTTSITVIDDTNP